MVRSKLIRGLVVDGVLADELMDWTKDTTFYVS